MDKYLLEILKQVSTIIIPGLGALTITNADTGEILFMPYLKHDDGKLVAHIAEKEGWDENEAKNLIAKYVREIQTDLDQGEDYTMYQFGSFCKEGDEIIFKNWDKNSGKVENEYIPPVIKEKVKKKPTKENPKVVELKDDSTKKVAKKTSSDSSKKEKVTPIIPLPENDTVVVKKRTILEKEEQKSTADRVTALKDIQKKKGDKKKKGIGFWIGITILVLLIISGAYVGLNYEDLKQKLPFLSENSASNSEDEQNSDLIKEETTDEGTFDASESSQEAGDILDELTEEITDDVIDEEVIEEVAEETQVVTESTDYSSELPYQIIAGAFSEEANATRLVEKLQGKGYPALQKQKGSKYMVSVKSFATIADAQAELSAIKEVASGGWIMKW